jgi:hypothetical protein
VREQLGHRCGSCPKRLREHLVDLLRVETQALAPTLAGAAILSLTDLRGHRETTYDDVYHGIPRKEARAFSLIVLGSAFPLQIIGVAERVRADLRRRALATTGAVSRPRGASPRPADA